MYIWLRRIKFQKYSKTFQGCCLIMLAPSHPWMMDPVTSEQQVKHIKTTLIRFTDQSKLMSTEEKLFIAKKEVQNVSITMRCPCYTV